MSEPQGSKAEVEKAGPSTGRSGVIEAARTYTPDFLQEMFANPLDAGYFDAAERRKSAGPLRASSRRIGFVLRMIALVGTGLLLAVAYQQTVAAKPETNKVTTGLVKDVHTQQKSTDGLAQKANTLRTEVTKLRNASLDAGSVKALTNLEAQTGLGPVAGSGAVVTMSDGPAPLDPITNQPEGNYLGRVQDLDLQTITNELWREGAEAISINGQRLTSTSTIRTAGDAILVDLVPLSEPYVISAIGPDNLAQQLQSSDVGATYERFISSYGMHFSIAKDDRLSLPAAPDPQLQYATVIPPSAPATPSPSGGH
ncbi:MAG TPA: DUF881 domain-containing protein [Micromonosporaceae bacterium]